MRVLVLPILFVLFLWLLYWLAAPQKIGSDND